MCKSDLYTKINKLKQQHNAVILAHNYQLVEVQQCADFVGDSLELAQKAATVKASTIVFCGVQFMAETAKLLNPAAKVLLPVADAGCPMADMITGPQTAEFRAAHPGAVVVCYVNSSVEVKAESDICCTSGNALKVAQSIPQDKTILFVPDSNLGTWVRQQVNHNVIVWPGHCRVHHWGFTPEDIEEKRKNYPDYKILVHPESQPSVFNLADLVASTKGMVDYVAQHDNVILGTEVGLYRMLKAKYPNKNLLPLNPKAICVNMKKTTLADVAIALGQGINSIELDQQIAAKALKSVQRMLDLS